MTTPLYPNTPAPASITPSSTQPTQVSLSHTLKRQVRSKGAQRWAFKISYVKRNREAMAPLIAFALAARGQFNTFRFCPPIIGSRRAGSGTPIVRVATATGRAIPVHGLTALSVVAKAGDYVKFTNGTKVYMLTADVIADADGRATLSIEPGLYAGVSVGEVVILDDVEFLVAFATDSHETPVSSPFLYSWDLQLVEVLP